MQNLKLFWNPEGVNVDALGSRTLAPEPPHDGDTARISMSMRFLSIDTPEVVAASALTKTNDKLLQLGQWMSQGKVPLDAGLAQHLLPKLQTAPATLQDQQGQAARNHLQQLFAQRLGQGRSVFLRTSDQPFDGNGRLLVYVAPNLKKEELATATPDQRATFNLLMVQAGWAASFPIFPSFPKHADLELLFRAAAQAHADQLGIWANPATLPAYEYRECLRLYELTNDLLTANKPFRTSDWVSRYCFDLATLQIVEPQHYYRIAPANRAFVWPQDVRRAVSELNLTA
jgi:endonuclease YncB( thermonuclease family)